jgi:phage FluMu protein Com
MKCIHCQKILNLDVETLNYLYYQCQSCHVYFGFNKDLFLVYYRYVFQYNEKTYKMLVNFVRKDFYLETVSPGKSHFSTILHLDYLPNITPKNIKKKLSTLLTFL